MLTFGGKWLYFYWIVEVQYIGKLSLSFVKSLGSGEPTQGFKSVGLDEVPFWVSTTDTCSKVLWIAKEDYEMWDLAREPSWRMPLQEMAVNNVQCKGRADKYQKGSQEQGRLPVGCVSPLSPSIGRGEEEVSRQSALVEELILQPLRSPIIPAGG